jgi:hypothetical protein
VIEGTYENYFYYPDGSTKSYFRMKTLCTEEIVIQHPLPTFDPLSDQIYREEYILKYPNNSLVPDFIRLTEDNSNIGEDEILWYNTGYWSILDVDYQYIGCGESALLDTMENIQRGKLVFCLCSRDFIMFIKSVITEGQTSGKSSIDIFCANSWLPFVEVIDPFRKVLRIMGEAHLSGTEKMSYSSIRTRISLRNNKNIMIPCAIMPVGERIAREKKAIGLAVIPNDFGSFEMDSVNSLEYILTSARGGSLKTDFFRSGTFCYDYFIERYSDVALLYGYYDVLDNDGIFLSIDNFEIDKTYLDYFDV